MIPILITLAVLLLACIACVVFVPFHLSLTGEYSGRLSGFLRVSWLWGALKIERTLDERKTTVYFLGRKSVRVMSTDKKEKRRGRRVKPRTKRPRNVSGVLSNIPEAVRLFRKIIRSLSPKGAVRGVVGLGDPAETGIMFGIASAFLALMPLPVQITPDFRKSVVAVSGGIEIRIFIASLIAIGIEEFLSPRGRKLMRSLR